MDFSKHITGDVLMNVLFPMFDEMSLVRLKRVSKHFNQLTSNEVNRRYKNDVLYSRDMIFSSSTMRDMCNNGEVLKMEYYLRSFDPEKKIRDIWSVFGSKITYKELLTGVLCDSIKDDLLDIIYLCLSKDWVNIFTLFVRACGWNITIVKHILERYLDKLPIDAISRAFVHACHYKDLEVLNLLIQYKLSNQKALLSAVAGSGNLKAVKLIYDYDESNKLMCNNVLNDALSLACSSSRGCSDSIMEFILAKGATNCKSCLYHRVGYSAAVGNIELAKEMFANGVNNFNNGLYTAANNNDISLALFLLDTKMPTNAKYCINVACKLKYYDFANIVMKNTNDPICTNCGQKTHTL